MRLLWSSDHHTLHNITPTAHILDNLTTFLCVDNDLAKVDMITFGGDFFERIVESPNPDMFKVQTWGKKFLANVQRANPNAIVVWLEGTASHDNRQPRQFLNLAPEGLEVLYIDTLCIKVFEKHDNLSILYVPDNMGNKTPDDIWEMALAALHVSGLEKVDLIHFHGGFDFQLHPKARHKAHQLERWETIVRFGIFSGHIHTPVQKGMLYSSGSFDRTRQGEEHPKGGYVIDLDKKTGFFNPVFYENKKALPYLSMSVDQDVTPKQLINDIHEFIRKRKMPHYSQLCIKNGPADVVNPVVAVLSKEYPHIGIKADNAVGKGILVDETMYDTSLYEGISLTRDNLHASLYPEVQQKFKELGISDEEALEILEEFL